MAAEPQKDLAGAAQPAAETGSGKMVMAMGAVGSIAAVLIVFTFQFTLPIIEANKAEYLDKSVYQVMSGATTKKAYAVDAAGQLQALADENDPAAQYYFCYNAEQKLVGIVVKASGQGFQDVIRLIYGYDPDQQKVVGMKVLQSTETPGLGDKIEKDPVFLANFQALDVTFTPGGTSLSHPLELVKSGEKNQPWQISAITGATVSSRAVHKILSESSKADLPLLVQFLSQQTGE